MPREREGQGIRLRDIKVAEHRAEIFETRFRFLSRHELLVGHVAVLRTRIPEHAGWLAVERHMEEREVGHRSEFVRLSLEAGWHLVAGRQRAMGDVEEQGGLGEQVHAQQGVDLSADLGGQLVEGEAHVAALVHAVVLVLPGQAAGSRGAEGGARVDQGAPFGEVDEQVTVEEIQLVGADHGAGGAFMGHFVNSGVSN